MCLYESKDKYIRVFVTKYLLSKLDKLFSNKRSLNITVRRIIEKEPVIAQKKIKKSLNLNFDSRKLKCADKKR